MPSGMISPCLPKECKIILTDTVIKGLNIFEIIGEIDFVCACVCFFCCEKLINHMF